MAMRNRGATSLAAGAAPAQPSHLGGGPGLVDEDELRRVELGLEIEPGLAACGYVLARLLAGVRRLFERDPVAAVEVVDRTECEGLAALGDQPLAQLCQGDVQHRVDRPHQKLRLRLDPTRAPVAPARLRR